MLLEGYSSFSSFIRKNIFGFIIQMISVKCCKQGEGEKVSDRKTCSKIWELADYRLRDSLDVSIFFNYIFSDIPLSYYQFIILIYE